jgi:sugar lactone lactonase YvrE
MKCHAILLMCAGLASASLLGADQPKTTPKKASHDESVKACIGASKALQFSSLTWITNAGDGSLIACDRGAGKVLVVSPDGTVQKAIKSPTAPYAACPTGDAICIAGKDRILIAGPDGTITKNVTIKAAGLPTGAAPAGMASTADDIFISYCRIPGQSVSGAVYRLDADLSGAKLIGSGYRGCCGNLAIGAHDGKVYIAENASHRVVVLDREGKVVKRWGERSRDDVEGFASCCNPMALCVDKNGTVYTSESGPNRIKRYTSDGQFLGLVGELGKPIRNSATMASSCSNTAVAVSTDGSQVFVVDERNNLIRVLVRQD